jgi:hypothetical protein
VTSGIDCWSMMSWTAIGCTTVVIGRFA